MNENPRLLTAALAAAGPLLLLAFGFLPTSLLNRNPQRAAQASTALSLGAFAFALLAGLSMLLTGPADLAVSIGGPVQAGIYFDNLSAIVLTVVSFLLAVVARYSRNYLAGDAAQGRFSKWLALTGGSVLALVLSGNLIQFATAWSATSLSLHQLLVLYPNRPGALLAARKKFIISRLGDTCLIAVIMLVYQTFHTWQFTSLFAAARELHQTGLGANQFQINLICFLLVAGAMLKSAQFPFHSWLPDTMETPTPVSALMHAGIINAGGFLIIRLNPLVTLSPAALSTLALFGAFTALFASLVMLTHASVKRSLAFSTIAQMGFMMLECGLGAFPLAVLHLVAHSLYKAHAFLSSGSIVNLAKAAWTPTEKPNSHPLTLVAALTSSLLITFGGTWVFQLDWRTEPGWLVLGSAFAMALAYVLWNLWSQALTLKLAAFGLVLGAGIAASCFTLHKLFNHLLGQNTWTNTQLGSWPGLVLVGTILLLFLLVLIGQTELPQWGQKPLFRALYVHARNGFYFNTLANRFVAALWPLKT
ncbi:MAG: dehydrogenase [Verrucomicrobiales bacterium]|nr:dehydrogenase [Verrucomicrobiales bacterium]